ncbi:ribokinase [Kitasatospora sp. RB6PN24]|uniref:ribokinase n=1 Tax=Kitasatospora humi TaxID=2893891 RepID=UPI001E62CA9F|nr:ribokinase [Kitasatospora humi]MCC9311125.1 ribokinase [Kitasatospora humi]
MADVVDRAVVVVGSVNLDQVIEVGALPRPGETVRGGPVLRLGGGKGANQAVAAARLGASVTLVGAVGTDADSARLREELAAEGVDVDRLASVPGPPGQAIVLVDAAAENCIVVSPGANAAVGPAEVMAAREPLARAAVVLAQLEIGLPAVLTAARLSRGTFILNPAPAPDGDGLSEELWGLIDVLVPNRTELASLSSRTESAASRAESATSKESAASTVDLAVSATGSAGAPTGSAERATGPAGTPTGPTERVTGPGGAPTGSALAELVRQAAALPCDRVVVTLGAAGALVREGSAIELIPAPTTQAVDTTGAGDTFCGALAVALAEGRSLVAAARFAARAAALSVTRTGARTAMPTRAALDTADRP